MDTNASIFKLQVITLLDSICYGLIYCFLSPYIQSLGADQFVIGVLAVGNLLCNLASAEAINNLAQSNGKRNILFMVFNTAMISHLMLILTNSYWFTILSRYIFSLTNQSQNLCKSLLLQKVSQDEQDYFLMTFSILSGAGYIIGPLISGCLFSTGFEYVCLLAAVLTFINSFLIMTVPMETEETQPQPDRRTMVEKTQNNVSEATQNFRNCDYDKNWDMMAIKFLYMSSVTIFSSKFTQILKHNFQASPLLIGFTYSYMNSLTFAGTYFAKHIRNKYVPDGSIIALIEYALIVTSASLLVACYSPVYSLYEIMCIPIIFSTNFLNSSWKDFFSTRGNDSLNQLDSSIGIAAGLTIPLIFGVICNVIGHHAAIIFSVGPACASLYVMKKYTKCVSSATTDKSKDD